MLNTPAILVLEDDCLIANHIKRIIEKKGYKVAGIATKRSEALAIASSQQLSLVIADVGLANNDCGIDVVNHIRLFHPVPVVFLTAYSDEQTMEKILLAKPSAYLNKPFTEHELLANVDIAILNHLQLQGQMRFPLLDEGNVNGDFIFIPTGKGFRRISKKEIRYIEASGSYVNVYTPCGVQMISTNIGSLERQLADPTFIRVSRKHLINIERIDAIENSCIIMEGRCLPIGDVYRQGVLSRLKLIRTK
jgi:DNA-binding LytR/AlgR family response regulator